MCSRSCKGSSDLQVTSRAMTKTTTTATTTATTTKTTKTMKATTKGPRVKGGRISTAKKAAGKAKALAMKKAGVGIFAPKTLSPAMATFTGKKSLPRTEVVKAIWKYIKAKGLNKGRIISPDATLKTIIPVASLDMLKMASFVSKHLS